MDSRALLEALQKRKLGAAGLDVYEEEGELFFEDKSTELVDDEVLSLLLTLPNVLITSHQGFFDRRGAGSHRENHHKQHSRVFCR